MPDLRGQWIGKIEGTNNGLVMLNVDFDRSDVGRIFVSDNVIPHHAKITITSGAADQITVHVSEFVPTAPIQEGQRLPVAASAEIQISGATATGTWYSDIDTNGSLSLSLYEPESPRPADKEFGWSEFVNWALKRDDRLGWVYRGQSDAAKALSTSFHRAGRRDLVRYCNEDVPKLRRAVGGVLNRHFTLNDAEEYGTLLNIAQHHGYPTPLLDFTESPFIAAYFAFSGIATRLAPIETPVRIYAYDALSNIMQLAGILDPKPTFVRRDLLTHQNPRALPQQSVNMFTNLVNIEKFISYLEEMHKRQLLEIVEIPAAEAPNALRDLRRFGISASSLFPGLEGACRGLAEQYFA